jgi:hypothetical protein
MSRNRRRTGPAQPPDWKFNSFPTYFAFAAGALSATVLILVGFIYFVFIAALFGFSFGVIHLITTVIVRSRRRTAQARSEEEERERRIYAARAAANAEAVPPPRKRRRRR